MPFLTGPGEVHFVGMVFEGELTSVSEANREGVEGEPQATLGGLLGSPRIGQWCRFCGSIANPSSDQCVPCWSKALGKTMEVTGHVAVEFADALKVLGDTGIAVAGIFAPSHP